MRFGQKIQTVPWAIVVAWFDPSGTSTITDRVQVVAGILRDDDACVLIAERLGDSAFVDLWEFPGGKIEAGEAPEEALRRELKEELGIEIVSFAHFQCIRHDYADRQVLIDFFLVSQWLGQPLGLQGQGLRWIPIEQLQEEVLLPADGPVVSALQAL